MTAGLNMNSSTVSSRFSVTNCKVRFRKYDHRQISRRSLNIPRSAFMDRILVQ